VINTMTRALAYPPIGALMVTMAISI